MKYIPLVMKSLVYISISFLAMTVIFVIFALGSSILVLIRAFDSKENNTKIYINEGLTAGAGCGQASGT